MMVIRPLRVLPRSSAGRTLRRDYPLTLLYRQEMASTETAYQKSFHRLLRLPTMSLI
jgi:hypothetical protein